MAETRRAGRGQTKNFIVRLDSERLHETLKVTSSSSTVATMSDKRSKGSQANTVIEQNRVASAAQQKSIHSLSATVSYF